VRNFKRPIREESRWQKYLRCSRIPDMSVPSTAREFLYKFLCNFEEYSANNLNWWVRCDERSLLTQDPSIPDTRRALIGKLRVPIGKFYDDKLRFMMKVYESLEDALRRRKVSEEHLNDLFTVVLFTSVFRFIFNIISFLCAHTDPRRDASNGF
jgi:hypothetical protein